MKKKKKRYIISSILLLLFDQQWHFFYTQETWKRVLTLKTLKWFVSYLLLLLPHICLLWSQFLIFFFFFYIFVAAKRQITFTGEWLWSIQLAKSTMFFGIMKPRNVFRKRFHSFRHLNFFLNAALNLTDFLVILMSIDIRCKPTQY